MNNIIGTIKKYYPGVAISIALGICSTAIGARYGAPVMLIALLVGLAAHFLYDNEKVKTGIDWTARGVLRFGIALLGFRIAVNDVIAVGWGALGLVLGAMAITLVSGVYIGRLLGQTREFGALSAGATAVCGVSAAIAISTVLPKRENEDRDLAVTVAGVTTLSTVAMIVYPLISHYFGMSEREAGILFGGTIHDVAQVAGAGYSISQKTGDLGTLVKLFRVAALLPMVLVIFFWLGKKKGKEEGGAKTQYFPPFLIAFFVFGALNSFHLIPKPVVNIGTEAAKFFLLISIAAIGVKTDLRKIIAVGWKPLVLLVIETIIMLGVVFGGVLLMR